MAPIFLIGMIIFTGFLLGELALRLGLPKVTGYIISGLILNPDLTHLVSPSFIEHTTLMTNLSLAFITFSVGGTLLFSKIRALGKSIVYITLFEAECAYAFVAAGFILLGPLLMTHSHATLGSFFIPLGLLLASLASPTDPSATLAVEHEYKAKGKVSSTIMGVAAFDDILGIINFSLAISIASIAVTGQTFGTSSFLHPLYKIGGALLNGCVFGVVLNGLTKMINKETEGVLITVIIGVLSLCYGLAVMVGVDELLSTMTMGVLVVNWNMKQERLFQILERYTEELVFVLFFTISAMHLNFSVLISNAFLILVFVLFRTIGKFSGTVIGGTLSNAGSAVRKYTAGGLIPQGGIVIGLALLIKQNAAFDAFSDIILNIIIGATIVHEIIGPVVSKVALKRAGEISSKEK